MGQGTNWRWPQESNSKESEEERNYLELRTTPQPETPSPAGHPHFHPLWSWWNCLGRKGLKREIFYINLFPLKESEIRPQGRRGSDDPSRDQLSKWASERRDHLYSNQPEPPVKHKASQMTFKVRKPSFTENWKFSGHRGNSPYVQRQPSKALTLLEERDHNSYFQNKGADPPKLMIRAVLGHRDGSEQVWAETNTGTEKRKNSFFSKLLGSS